MKRTLVTLSLILISMGASFESQAQDTITENNFPRPASFIDTVSVSNQTGTATPTEGADQVWDYSSLRASDTTYLIQFSDAAADTNFTNALNYGTSNLIFQSFLIHSNLYESIDANGWYYPGRTITDVTYSIASITAGANDSLNFVGGKEPFDGRINTIQFPMTYGTQWNQTHNEFIHFKLSVASYSLVNTPGYRKQVVTQNREVVGYGKLTIPTQDSTPSPPMDVLLVKVKQTIIDSLYLAGTPAPAPLLAAFGLTQGSVDSSSYYVFYAPNFGSPIMTVNLNDSNKVTTVTYRFTNMDTTTSVSNIVLPELKVFPNPVKAGQEITIQMGAIQHPGSISFYTIDGRLVHKMTMNNGKGNNFQITIPKAMTQGLYMYQVNNQFGKPVASGKLLVK